MSAYRPDPYGKKTVLDELWNEGWHANGHGQPRSDCPYFGGRYGQAWLAGWDASAKAAEPRCNAVAALAIANLDGAAAVWRANPQ